MIGPRVENELVAEIQSKFDEYEKSIKQMREQLHDADKALRMTGQSIWDWYEDKEDGDLEDALSEVGFVIMQVQNPVLGIKRWVRRKLLQEELSKEMSKLPDKHDPFDPEQIRTPAEKLKAEIMNGHVRCSLANDEIAVVVFEDGIVRIDVRGLMRVLGQ